MILIVMIIVMLEQQTIWCLVMVLFVVILLALLSGALVYNLFMTLSAHRKIDQSKKLLTAISKEISKLTATDKTKK